ncbi:UNKNOWN [Stylonychia lemnae]|uniref:VWFA domain-containing protein n=1 Tax=Stylonychia lemnae TaxID=5949 RepID=A0A078A3M9_STYLE|nr:UNKNOWN [Stylonychia lemnae]|eukprot:CDW75354.1 UNKNOWN [Stylonychia lemnae]
MESSQTKNFTLKYFPIRQDYVYAQISTQMKETDFNQLTGITPGETQSADGRALILCFDQSGSMSGKPFEALQKGAIMIGESIFATKDYEKVSVCYYDDSVHAMEANDLIGYQKYVNSQCIRGSTNFVAVFKYIEQFLTQYSGRIRDVSVIFFTDGQDTCNNKEVIEKSLQNLKAYLQKNNLNSRFLTVGFTSSHDAPFLNRISNTGSELGNFFYINTDTGDYSQQIQECLSQSVSMAGRQDGLALNISSHAFELKQKLNLQKNYVIEESKENEDGDGDAEMNEEIKMDDNANELLEFSEQIIIREGALQDLRGELVFGKKTINITFELVHVENPPAEVLSRAQIKYINKLIFETVQEIQSDIKVRTHTELLEYIMNLDKELDSFVESSMKIKDRDLRKVIMEEIGECKDKTSKVMEVLRASTGGRINNVQIAQLNDLAYKAVRKRGLQKKLDERAVKNEGFYKKLDQQLKGVAKKMDFKALREEYKDLIDMIGSCPISTNDLIQTMEESDCMCLGLDVGRSEAAIADPTRLVIKDIIPTFMSADSFLTVAAFTIKRNEEAHGGYDVKNQGQLALGVGRENITGIMPLYLFKEHWEFARRKAPPVYGFITTLDVMGYASSQYFTVPYLVLLKALEKNNSQKVEIYSKIVTLVLETCKNIMSFNEEHRKMAIQQIVDFHKNPESRTADIVASIPVMLAQLYVITLVENYESYLPEDFKLDQPTLANIFRFAFEEHSRRCIRSDAEILTKNTILKALFPDYATYVDEIMKVKEIEIQNEFKKDDKQGASSDQFSEYTSQANFFKALDQANLKTISNEEESNEEEKKEDSKISGGEEKKQDEKVDLIKAADDAVAKLPWQNALKIDGSDSLKLVSSSQKYFNKKQQDLIILANLLKVGDLKGFGDLPQINNDNEVMLSLFLQNAMNPKNHHRRESIQNKNYREILNTQDSQNYLRNILLSQLRNEFAGRESAIRSVYLGAKSSAQVQLFLDAPNIYTAAAIMCQNHFSLGQGDYSLLIQALIDQSLTLSDARGKLQLVCQGQYFGTKLYKDAFKIYPANFNPCKTSLYRLYMKLVKNGNKVTHEEFLNLFPHIAAKAEVWDKVLDNSGKIAENLDWFNLHNAQVKQQKLQEKNQRLAQQSKKLKF